MIKQGAQAVLGAVAVALLAGCGPSGPAIQEVSPGKGETNVAGNAPIQVTFNNDMDRPTVESRFVVSPTIPGCDAAACPIRWSGRTMVLAHAGHQFNPDTRYRVTLHPGYRDSAGRVESLEHFWDFQTETAPGVTAVTPADGTTGVPVDVDVVVQLSRPVLLPPKQELTLVAADDPEPVTYRVAVAPDDARKLVVSPIALLHPRTRYTVHVGTGVRDYHHNPLPDPVDSHFTTGAVDLTRSLGFLVRDEGASSSSRIGVVRPPAAVNAPAPSIRVLFTSDRPLVSFAWAADATTVYALDSGGALTAVPLDGSPPANTGKSAQAFSVSPARDDVAYVAPDGTLRLWSPSAGTDQAVAQAGRVGGSPAWSGDGRRLAFVSTDAAGGAELRVLDRETLSITPVTAISVPASGAALAWTTDGEVLAFARTVSGHTEAWTYRPLAAAAAALTRIDRLDGAALCWSSDGALLFGAGRPAVSRAAQIYQALGQPLDGQATGFTPVRGSKAGDRQPSAPSFDRRLAFIRDAAGMPQLWIMNNDGSGVSQLTFAAYDREAHLPTAGVDQPRWAPGPPLG